MDENLEGFDPNDKVRELFKLLKEDNRKDDNNECTLLKCSCGGLLVQMPEYLPLMVRCVNCKGKFLLKDIIKTIK